MVWVDNSEGSHPGIRQHPGGRGAEAADAYDERSGSIKGLVEWLGWSHAGR
jgi:hypothetical protein